MRPLKCSNCNIVPRMKNKGSAWFFECDCEGLKGNSKKIMIAGFGPEDRDKAVEAYNDFIGRTKGET